ncbi:iron-sulfur cluster assembly scaffold protein [bacterium]|nr:iron-sulfur cluster assembly scaffold protein [bacterium]
MDDEIYTQNILERYRHPKNKRAMADFDVREAGVNPSCGDSLMLYLKFGDDGSASIVEDASFDGEGCAISQAAADMLMGKIHGMAKQDLQKISEQDVYDMLGIPVGPGREKCALLALHALKNMK